MTNHLFKPTFSALSGEKMGIKMKWEDFARSMGVEPQILENKEARLLKQFVMDLKFPTHCQAARDLI